MRTSTEYLSVGTRYCDDTSNQQTNISTAQWQGNCLKCSLNKLPTASSYRLFARPSQYRTHLYRAAERTTAQIPGVQVLLHRQQDTGSPPSTKTRSRLRHSRTSRRVAPFSPRHISKPDKPHPRTHAHPLARTQRTRLVPVLARSPRQRRLVPFLFRHSRPLPPFSIVSPLG